MTQRKPNQVIENGTFVVGLVGSTFMAAWGWQLVLPAFTSPQEPAPLLLLFVVMLAQWHVLAVVFAGVLFIRVLRWAGVLR